MKKLLFDMDGTLLDSMPMWYEFETRFLEKKKTGLWDKNYQLEENSSTLTNGVRMIRTFLDTDLDDLTIGQIINSFLRDFYGSEVKAKENVYDKLEELDQEGYDIYVATATDIEYASLAIKHTGLDRFVKKIYTPDTLGHSKKSIEYFEAILEDLEIEGRDAVFFDDVLYANRLAHSAGIKTIGVYDKTADHKDKIKDLVDYYIYNFNEIDEKKIED